MDCLTKAVRRRAFSRGLLAPELSVPEVEVLAARLRDGLRTRFRQRLAMARRAGAVIAGENGVARAFKGGKGGVLVLAWDLSVSSRKKQVTNAGRKGVPVVNSRMGGEELGQCLGREYAGIILVEAAPFAGEIQGLAEQWNELVREDPPQEAAH
jgi:ribosomal protein L30E